MQYETERLILRYYKEDDLESIFFNYANDPEVAKYVTWPAHKSLEDTKKFIEYLKNEDPRIQEFHFFLELKETHELIGSCSVAGFNDYHPEIGYCLGKKWWNQGLMTEACNKLIEIIFESGYSKILINAVDENIASNRVIEKCGFKYLKADKVFLPLKNKWVTCKFYELNRL